MGFEIITIVTVGANGHIEADLPELVEGQRVEVTVRVEKPFVKGFGGMAGAIGRVPDDFDAPLGEFSDYS